MDNKRKRYEGYCTDIITDRALDWLKNKRDKDKPFVLMCQHKAPHRNWSPAPRHLTLFDDIEMPEPNTLFDDYEGNRSKTLKDHEMGIKDHMYWGHDMKFHGKDSKFPEHFLFWTKVRSKCYMYRRITSCYFCIGVSLNNSFLT